MKYFLLNLLVVGVLVTVAGGETRHRVKNGETLHRIAERYSVSPKSLQRYNALRNPNVLRVGQVLRIPTKERKSRSSNSLNIYEIRKGDTFIGISKKFEVTPRALKLANPKINPSKIYIGQRLRVPGDEKASEEKSVDLSKKIIEKEEEREDVLFEVDYLPENREEEIPEQPLGQLPAIPFVKVVITRQISLGDFSKHYSMTTDQVNDVNGWNYSAQTVFDIGSEAYVFRN